MVERRRATRIRVYLWSRVGFWAGLTGVWLLLGELRDWLGGVHHLTMQVYTLGVLLKSKFCWSRFS